MHKRPIKFETLKKLPSKQKDFFRPNICDSLNGPVRMIKFQRDHQLNLFRLTENYVSLQKLCYYLSKSTGSIFSLLSV